MLAQAIFGVGPEIRYVATYLDGRLQLQQRDGWADASAPGSDRFEELLVEGKLKC